MEGRQERAEPLDRAHDLSSLSGEVEAVARGDRSMQQCPLTSPGTRRSSGEGFWSEGVSGSRPTSRLCLSPGRPPTGVTY